MTNRLERHDRITKLRSKPIPLDDDEITGLLDDLNASGIVEELAPLIDHDKGRPRHLTLTGLLLGMFLAAARNAGTVTMTTVADILAFRISEPLRAEFGIPHYPDNDQGFEAFYAVVRRLFHRVREAVDPSPLPKNHRLDKDEAARLQAEADPEALASKRGRLLSIANRILGMSLRQAHELLENSTWTGDYAVDATVIGTYAKGLPNKSEVTSTDPEAGWYMRTRRHKDPLALNHLDPTNNIKTKGKKGMPPSPQEQIVKALFGYDATLIIARDPEHDGAPLSDGSADPEVIPALVVAFSVEKPSTRPAEVALEALNHIDPRHPRGYLAGDRLYNDQQAENFQLPIRAMGFKPVYDYAKDQLGSMDEYEGAQLVEGNWYCPSMPEHLVDATADLIAGRVDKQTWIERTRQRTQYLFLPKQAADAEGHRRMMCPAQAGRVQCPLKPHTMGKGVHITLVDVPPSPVEPHSVCKNGSVTFPPEAGAQLWQPLQHGREDWQRIYFRLRNSVEGVNGFGKDPLYEHFESGGTRRIRGIAAQTLLLAFQLGHANRRKLTAWADAIALNGDRPRRRPTRRRKTKPLGAWTPKGYLTKTDNKTETEPDQ
ncbi:hypothetical protein [Streptomyces sp. CC219B]|uniref:hypothetical protein n=1 Tax=Streptomyces sp. CC219B TaxID=3044574 RepID=UPI0024A7C12C|nr:hypothetical protein [Streptomyces sp. CC219B]